MSLIVISFDGVTDKEFEKMAGDAGKYPSIAAFMSASQYTGGVPTLFVSNTYPIHTSISTGKLPTQHGVVSNLLGQNAQGHDIWAQDSSLIKTKTIFDACNEKGLKAGTIAWPVTCNAKIKWNLPEVHILPGQSRLLEQMRRGSPLFQIASFLRHKNKLKGIMEPELDDFLTSVAVDLLKQKKPDLTMLHLLAYDSIRHESGLSPNLDIARASLDTNLGRVMAAAPADAAIIIFSDHGHIDVEQTIDLEAIYGQSLYEQCSGSAFFTHPIEDIEGQPWFGRLLNAQELSSSGYSTRASFGVAAKPGFCFGKSKYAANHGYPTDYDDYNVFYAIKNNRQSTAHLPFNDIRNVTALIARELDLDMDLGDD